MKKFLLVTLALFFTITAQEEKKDIHQFKMINEVKTTSVKDQGSTGTCWAFAATSYFETELLRMGKGEYDLSEMFVVRNTYPLKAEKYIRRHGTSNFSQGGQAHDVLMIYKNNGIVPEEIYAGNPIEGRHNHNELEYVMKGMLDGVLAGRKLTDKWDDALSSTLDAYLGDIPEEFSFNGDNYSPKMFFDELGINPDDYIEFTSYNNRNYYDWIELEIPDNWTNDKYFNIPMNDILEIMDNALSNGYSICWDGDSGKDHFYRNEGYAVIPVDDEEKLEDRTEPEKEKEITEDLRIEAFNSFDVTDDHLMHIVGTAENQNGTKFYYTKNSWGTKDKKYDGYWYISEAYVKLKTVAIMVHKDAVPKSILGKMK